MRQVTANEKYRAVKNGILAESEFVRQMKLAFPQFLTSLNGYKDTVQILKNYNILSEDHKNDNHANISDDSIRRGLDVEIAALGHDPVTCEDAEVQAKAKAKAIANIKKDPLYYYNLLAKESSKVDKHDKYTETKRGKLEKDTFNDMKKATLKEAKLMTEGTRALIGYLAGDRLTTTYNHYDGYPSNLGVGLETHYNDDDKAKDIAMKGYITGMDADTGEITQTHNDAPGKLKLPEDVEERAREIAEEIDKMGADYGYIWVDEANMWTVVKNTGIRSMIDQIVSKISEGMHIDDEEWEAEMGRTPEDTEKAIDKEMSKNEVDSTLDPYEDKKAIIQQVIDLLKTEKRAGNEVIKDFIKTHYEDIINLRDDQAILDEFEEFISVNYEAPSDFMNEETDDVYGDGDVVVNVSKLSPGMKAVWEIEKEISEFGDSQDAQSYVDDMAQINSDDELVSYLENRGIDTQTIMHMVKAYNGASVNEKKGKDHDGDGDIDGDDYKAAKDKAIKKAMGKGNVKEAVKNIITKVLEEQVLNEAATQELARIADEYGDFGGLKSAVIDLENIVTDIEAYYDKTREKIQKIYNALGDITNEEGLKVGAFIAPSIEAAFNKDLRPAVKRGFTSGLDTPKVKTISKADVDRGYVQQEAPKDTVFRPVNEIDFGKKEIINNVSFPNGVTFEVGQYSNEYGMTVTSIEPVPEGEREEDEVVYVAMQDGDDGISVPFNANGEEVEI